MMATMGEAMPGFAVELAVALRNMDRAALAQQLHALPIVERCRCDSDYCATFYAVTRPGGPWGPGHETVHIDGMPGIVNVDVLNGAIVEVEVLYRDDVRTALSKLPELSP